MKKVSVILTSYNSENVIQNTLDSIRDQKGIDSAFELELLVVDDCSTDGTTHILQQNQIEYLSTRKNSGGPNKGRNIALKAATGDYICIADHDDEWRENKIISLIPYLEKVPVVTSGYTLIDSVKNKKIERVNPHHKPGESFVYYEANSTFLTKLTKSYDGQNTYLGSIMYKSELKHILFEEHFGVVDFDWVLRLFHQNPSIEVCASLYNRYVDGSNLSLNESYRRKDFYYSLMFIENYEHLYPKEVKISYKKINGSRARYYYFINNMKKARFYFLKDRFTWKTLGYYLTTYFGSGFVKKKYNVFG